LGAISVQNPGRGAENLQEFSFEWLAPKNEARKEKHSSIDRWGAYRVLNSFTKTHPFAEDTADVKDGAYFSTNGSVKKE